MARTWVVMARPSGPTGITLKYIVFKILSVAREQQQLNLSL